MLQSTSFCSSLCLQATVPMPFSPPPMANSIWKRLTSPPSISAPATFVTTPRVSPASVSTPEIGSLRQMPKTTTLQIRRRVSLSGKIPVMEMARKAMMLPMKDHRRLLMRTLMEWNSMPNVARRLKTKTSRMPNRHLGPILAEMLEPRLTSDWLPPKYMLDVIKTLPPLLPQ